MDGTECRNVMCGQRHKREARPGNRDATGGISSLKSEPVISTYFPTSNPCIQPSTARDHHEVDPGGGRMIESILDAN